MRALVVVVALAGCGNKEPAAKPPALLDGIELPTVSGGGFLPVDAHAPIVTASKTGIAVDGKPIAAIANGEVDPAAKEGGANGLKIHALSTGLRMQAELAGSGSTLTFRADGARPPLQVALDKQLTFGVLMEVLYSAKQVEAGYKSFEILARADKRIVHVPITLPDKQAAGLDAQLDVIATGEAPPAPENIPLRLFVSVSKTEIIVWSASQLEGSITEPKARVKLDDPTALDQLSKALAEIAQRRFAGRERTAESKQIVLQADRGTSMQRVIELLGAIRPAFPDVMFSAGFQ